MSRSEEFTGDQAHFPRCGERSVTEAAVAGGRISVLAPAMVWAYKLRACRPLVRWFLNRLEGGPMYSLTLRTILRESYRVDVGLYSYGPCLKPGVLPPGTTVGRYCSFGPAIQVFRRNHPKDRLSLHPFFYNRDLGIVNQDTIPAANSNPLRIENDVWIGYGTVILPNCRRIGNGAIIGACSVLTKDVPDFGIFAGNPAKLIGCRFGPADAQRILKSEWWLRPIGDLAGHQEWFDRSVDPTVLAAVARPPRENGIPSQPNRQDSQ